MSWSIPSLAIALSIASYVSDADARPRRGAPPALAPMPPAPPEAPMPPAPPMPIVGFAPDAPPPPPPPGFMHDPSSAPVVHSFSFATRPRLGIGISSMTNELRAFFGAKPDHGILVQSVETGTPAHKAGVKVGDVIVTVDGDRIDGADDIGRALADRGSGDKVEIELIRAKKKRRLVAQMAEQPQDAPAGPGARWHGGGDLRIEGLPPEAMRFFGGADEAALRDQLEALSERLEALEQRLGHDRPAPRAPKRPAKPSKPRRAPRPAADHT
jgi:membrane-associated protease RseP (regulator of RpoE activity)